MSTILVKCQDQVLAFENTPLIASGDVGVDFVQFSFCDLWDGYKRAAVFWRNEKDVYHVNLDEEDRCEIPKEVLQDGGLIYFGAFGVNAAGQQRTSKVLTYRIEQGAITTDTKPSDPTPDIYTQIMQEFLTFEAVITSMVELFEQTMGDSWTQYQTDMGQAWATYQEAMSQQQSTFEQTMTQAWEKFKTGGDFVLKTDYEADKVATQEAIEGKAASDHKHDATEIETGVLPVERGGTGTETLAGILKALFPTAVTPTIIPIFGNNWEGGGYATLASLKTALGAVQVATGSYTGTNTSGSGNKNSLTFSFVPKLLVIVGVNQNSKGTKSVGMINANGGFGSPSMANDGGADGIAPLYASVSGKTISWYYGDDATNRILYQQNSNAYKYYYVALGV